MIRPNITEGNWLVKNYTYTEYEWVIESDGIIIADSLSKGDAQAISAVPEMIEALKQVYKEAEGYKLSSDTATKVERALKKAGATYETTN